MDRLLLCLVAIASLKLAASDPFCEKPSSDNCHTCNIENVEGGLQRCGWCVPLLQCVTITTDPVTKDLISDCGRPGNIVTHSYTCDKPDSTPTLFISSLANGSTNGNFTLTMEGENFGLDWKNGTEPGETRRHIIIRVGPFNCSATDQSPVVKKLDPIFNKYPYDSVSCNNLPGIGSGLRACAETRGAGLCNHCGLVSDKGVNHSSCPTWLPPDSNNYTSPGVVQNSTFNFSKPMLDHLNATCLDYSNGVCMIKKGGKIILNGSNFPRDQTIVDIFDQKVLSPFGEPSWDPGQRRGLRIMLGEDYNCTSYPDIGPTALSCVIGPGAGTNLSLSLEVGGVIINASKFGYEFRYQGPHIDRISPTDGPSYGGQRVTIFGEGFGVHTHLASVLLHDAVGNTVQVTPSTLTDTQMVFVTPPSHTNDQLFWNVSIVAGGQRNDHNGSVPLYTQRGCAASCKMAKMSGTCWPAGECQCTGVFNFSSPNSTSQEASCICDETDPCGHGQKDCANNKCVCLDQWSTALVGNHSLVDACTVCSLSCALLDKEVTGGDDCHCTFNKVHLVWMIGVPILLVILAIVAYNKHNASKAPAEPQQGLLEAGEAADAVPSAEPAAIE